MRRLRRKCCQRSGNCEPGDLWLVERAGVIGSKLHETHLTRKGADQISHCLGSCEAHFKRNFKRNGDFVPSQKWARPIIEERFMYRYLLAFCIHLCNATFRKLSPRPDLSKYEPPLDTREKFGHFPLKFGHSLSSYFWLWIAMALIQSQQDSINSP